MAMLELSVFISNMMTTEKNDIIGSNKNGKNLNGFKSIEKHIHQHVLHASHVKEKKKDLRRRF